MIGFFAVPGMNGGAAMIDRVRFLPNLPEPLVPTNWSEKAHAMHSLLFNPDLHGQFLPLVWVNAPSAKNPTRTFGMPSYVGHDGAHDFTGEGIAQLGALLGSVEAGIDIQKGKVNWLAMAPQYFNRREGLVLNNVGGKTGASFWYEILPSLDFVQLSIRNPDWQPGVRISKAIADSWIHGEEELGGNFDHTALKFASKEPVDNKLWIEPDAASGVSYLELCQALRSGDSRYYKACFKALQALEIRTTNPTYEILAPFGALTAAYLNAEKKENWDVSRFTNWCFEPTAPQRAGWGMIVGKWGQDDVGGLMGSVTDGGGYAFAMNTFVSAATLAPIARYDSRFARDIAKWILNLSNAARLYYRDGLPADHQSSAAWTGDPGHGLAYEGLRRAWDGKSPFATGDATRDKWAHTDFGVYGSGYVGMLAALVHPTDVAGIPRIDLRATDPLPISAYQTDLYWNPYSSTKTVTVPLEPGPVRVYDAVSHRFLSRTSGSDSFRISLASNQVVELVQVPVVGRLRYSGWTTKVGGVPIDYSNGREPRPTHPATPPADHSVHVDVTPVVLRDGNADWTQIKSLPISVAAGGNGTMRADLRFAWDKQYLYFQVKQTAPGTQTLEAKSKTELEKHSWDFEDISFDLDPGRGMFSVAAAPVITVAWSSSAETDLAYSPDLKPEALQVQTSGTASSADREIRGRIAWDSLKRAYGTSTGQARWPAVGMKLGCQPLLVDGTFKRQAYIGGTPYAKPSGLDANSRTLVLAAD